MGEWSDSPDELDEFEESLRELVQRPQTITIPTDWHQRSQTWAASQSGSSTSSDSSTECLAIEKERTSRESQGGSFEDILPLVPERKRSSRGFSKGFVKVPTIRETPANGEKRIKNVKNSEIHHCVVCGDKPTGYHYDVLSCNGCKTFFRRTIISGRTFRCNKGGNCQFTKDFRCACRSCRFNKCEKVGMNPKAIQWPPGKKGKNDLVKVKSEEIDEDEEQFYQEDVEMVDEIPCGSSSPPSSLSPLGGSPTMDKQDFQYLQMMSNIESSEKFAREWRKKGCAIFYELTLKELLQMPCFTINEVENQSESLQIYRESPLRYWMVTDLQLTVEFAKTFNTFRDLSIQDQQVLISQVGVAMQVCSQSFYSLEQKNDALVFPDGLNALHYKLSNGEKREHLYRELYCRPIAMMKELGMSAQDFQIFKTLLLFSPYGLELSEEGKNVVEKLHLQLVRYLRMYYLREYGEAKGSAKFAKVLIAMGALIHVAEKKRLQLHLADIMCVRLSKLGRGVFLKQF